jgi:hypothetical protein
MVHTVNPFLASDDRKLSPCIASPWLSAGTIARLKGFLLVATSGPTTICEVVAFGARMHAYEK